MKVLYEISENEFIIEFLKGEINSDRFGNIIKNQLRKDGRTQNIITAPDLDNKNDNDYRKLLLGKCRGYGLNKNLFENFPSNIEWKKVLLSSSELSEVKYINYDYWVELSNGTRYPRDAAQTIQKGIEVFGEPNDKFIKAAEYIENGGTFNPLILVGKNFEEPLVTLEGHLLLTSYFLVPKYMPNTIECLVGFSEDITNWDLY